MKIAVIDSGIGLISILKELVMASRNNEYHIFIDRDNFPYGNKTNKEIIEISKNLANKIKKQKIEIVIIACNTLSLLLDESFSQFKVYKILDYNLQLKEDETDFIATSLCQKLLDKENLLSGGNLASLIEEENFAGIIAKIKALHFSSRVVLGCTHYPLVEELFSYYHRNTTFIHGGKLLTAAIPNSNKMEIVVNNNLDYEIISKYFSNISIKLNSPS